MIVDKSICYRLRLEGVPGNQISGKVSREDLANPCARHTDQGVQSIVGFF
jgi:hypothetical protein